MDLNKTKEKLKLLIDESDNEALLNEIRQLLEIGTDESYALTEEQKSYLNELEAREDKGELKWISWEELRQGLLEKLKK